MQATNSIQNTPPTIGAPRESHHDAIALPEDAVLMIFSFLQPRDWCLGAGRACKSWCSISEADSIWALACAELWEGKANVKIGMPFPFAWYHPSIEFSVKELKYILTVRGLDVSQFIEKSEYRNAIALSDNRIRTPGTPLKGKWRASYVYSLKDSKRLNINENELCEMEWTFFFKSNPMDFSSKARFDYNKRTRQPRFVMNPWPMDQVTELHWQRNGRGDIIIHNFPAHVVFRRDDWSFGMQNEHVIFFQSNIPGFNEDAIKAELLQTFVQGED